MIEQSFLLLFVIAFIAFIDFVLREPPARAFRYRRDLYEPTTNPRTRRRRRPSAAAAPPPASRSIGRRRGGARQSSRAGPDAGRGGAAPTPSRRRPAWRQPLGPPQLPNVVVRQGHQDLRRAAFTAIKDVTFKIHDTPGAASSSSILGPSGCGKSTVIRLIAGLRRSSPQTSGTVLVDGKPILGPGSDRGMVFQDYTSFDNRTVLENVAFGLECRGVGQGASATSAPGVDRQGRPHGQSGRRRSTRTSCRAACASASRSRAR